MNAGAWSPDGRSRYAAIAILLAAFELAEPWRWLRRLETGR